MKTFLFDILPKIQRYSEKLDSLTLLTNKHWVHITDNHEKLVYIFRSQHNQLLISRNGLIEKAHWEHLGNNCFLVDQKNGSYLFKHGFIDDTVLALKTDGNDQFALFINESKFSEGIDTLSKIVAHLRQKYLDNEVGEFIKPIQDSLTIGNQKRVKAEKEKGANFLADRKKDAEKLEGVEQEQPEFNPENSADDEKRQKARAAAAKVGASTRKASFLK